jgi:hypothetical protein
MFRHGAILVAAVASAALVLAGSALGGKPFTAPVEFTLSSDTCSQLPPGTTIEFTGTETVSVSNSTLHTDTKGTATDNAGNTWRFNYHNNTRLLNDAGDVQVVDHFNLVGNGGVLHLHSHFVIVFRANGDVEVKQVTGDPEGCDPI